jgi:hypothetical protein
VTRALWLLLPPVILLVGCVAVVPRTHEAGLVEELGIEAAQHELAEVSFRAIERPVLEVTFNDVGFIYEWESPGEAGYAVGQGPLPAPRRHVAVVFANLVRLELYENHVVYVISKGERFEGKIRFQRARDAERWCDLVNSLWHHSLDSE